MKIDTIEIYQSRIKLKEPFVISLGTLTHAENLIVVILTDSGFTGYGECSPFATINGESMETGFAVGKQLALRILGKDPRDIAGLSLLMDRIIFGNSSIKSAFDIALHDIAAQHAGLPLYAFLGGKKNKRLFTDYTVSLGLADKMAKDALAVRAAGFPVIKVKLGESAETDIERIRLIREAIGPEIPLRLDANQGWTSESAVPILTVLAPYNIQFCEEPIPRWNFMNLPRISAQSPVPVMADESCCDHHDAERLIGMSACPMFNVKLGKSSGIVKALKIIRLAEEAGITLQVGGFLESRLGFTASAHLALTSGAVLYCDFDSPLMMEEDPVEGGITYGTGGEIHVPDVPGSGATIKKDFLERMPCAFF